MSAFICSDNHIITVARGLLESNFSQTKRISLANSLGDKAEELGFSWLSAPEALLLANKLAVNARYRDKKEITKNDLNISGIVKTVSGLEMIKLISCLEYQISEFDTLDTSNEALFCKFVCDVLDQYKNSIILFLTKDLAWAID